MSHAVDKKGSYTDLSIIEDTATPPRLPSPRRPSLDLPQPARGLNQQSLSMKDPEMDRLDRGDYLLILLRKPK